MRIIKNNREMIDTGSNPWALDIIDRNDLTERERRDTLAGSMRFTSREEKLFGTDNNDRYALAIIVYSSHDGKLFEWGLKTYPNPALAEEDFERFIEMRHVIDLRRSKKEQLTATERGKF